MMKRNIVLIIALCIGMGAAFAQNGTNKETSKSKQTEMEKLRKRVDDEEKAFQNCFDTDKSLKSLKEPIKNNVKKHHESVKSALEAIIEIQQDQLVAYQDELSVFRFFSNTEETIFADSTLEQNGWQKKLTGTYLTQYEIISRIRNAEQAISDVENIIEDNKSQKEKKKWTEDQLQAHIILDIENAIKNEIAQQLDEIDKMELSFLSPQQKEYYKKLSDRFDKIFNTYF